MKTGRKAEQVEDFVSCAVSKEESAIFGNRLNLFTSLGCKNLLDLSAGPAFEEVVLLPALI